MICSKCGREWPDYSEQDACIRVYGKCIGCCVDDERANGFTWSIRDVLNEQDMALRTRGQSPGVYYGPIEWKNQEMDINDWQKQVKNAPCEDGAYSICETHHFSECITYSESGDYPENRSE